MIPGDFATRSFWDARPTANVAPEQGSGRENPIVTRARLIHFRPDRAAGRVGQLESAGLSVAFAEIADSAGVRRMAGYSTDIYMIDLERLPLRGRESGLWLRRRESARRDPLLYLGGRAGEGRASQGVAPRRFLLRPG
jgi:hypothetical protein